MAGRTIRKPEDFHSQAALIFAGDEVAIEVLREGQHRPLQILAANEDLEKVRGARIHPLLKGTELQNFRDQDELGAGVLVTGAAPSSRASQAGLRPGDLIVEVNRRGVRNTADLREGARRAAQRMLLQVYRSGRFGYISINQAR